MDVLHLSSLLILASFVTMVFAAKDIRLPPYITEQSPKEDLVHYLQDDAPITLPCVASGFPTPDYEWKLDNRTLNVNEDGIQRISEGTIKIDFSYLRSGLYQCFASNQHGRTLTDVTVLHRASLGLVPPQPNDNRYVEALGNSLVVPCQQTKAVPTPSYSWQTVEFRDSEEAPNVILDQRIQQDDKGALYFANVVKDDEKNQHIYKCVITSPEAGGSKFSSYSVIEVTDGPIADQRPLNQYHTGKHEGANHVIAIKGQSLRLKCIFSGFPTPEYSWRMEVGSLPPDHQIANYRTELKLDTVREAHEGGYVCTGRNRAGMEEKTIQVIVKSAPEFITRPENSNVTEGDVAVFKCEVTSDPQASVTWLVDGNAIYANNLPSRYILESGGRVLKIQDVCKVCKNSERLSDLAVIQCNASNEHGYVFAAGYLNVLYRTNMTSTPKDMMLSYRKDVTFECAGTSDDSTPVTFDWFHNGQPLNLERPELSVENNLETGSSLLRIVTKDLQQAGAEYAGNFTCVVNNGYSTMSRTARLEKPDEPIPAPVTASLADMWWVFLLIGLLLLIAILVICCLCCRRDRGDEYDVDEKERENGNDPDKELIITGFQDYQRVQAGTLVKGSRASLASAMPLDEEDEDDDMVDYAGMRRYSEDMYNTGTYNTASRVNTASRAAKL